MQRFLDFKISNSHLLFKKHVILENIYIEQVSTLIS